jgi:tetratricopeptide (TPR) repeat protein
MSDRVTKAGPDDSGSADFERGRALLEAGDFAKAAAAFETSIARSPHFKSLELLGEALMRAGEPKRAIVPLAAATTLNAQVPAPSLLAEALLSVGDRLKAHEIAMLALSREPNNKGARTVFDKTRADHDTWMNQC